MNYKELFKNHVNNWSSFSNESLEGLNGKILKEVFQDDEEEALVFVTEDGDMYALHHSQDCCERVYIESIVGDLEDLIGSPLLMVEESTEDVERDDDWDDIEMWTFYKFATIKGYVDVRFNGSSNGYYSVGVDLIKFNKDLNCG